MVRRRGFTLIELLVVMAIIATLLSIAVPRYFRSVQSAQEAALREDLFIIRDALDKHYGDTGKYPQSLDELVSRKYLRKLPEDPITGRSDSWVLIASPDPEKSGIYDVKSGAIGTSRNGSPYSEW